MEAALALLVVAAASWSAARFAGRGIGIAVAALAISVTLGAFATRGAPTTAALDRPLQAPANGYTSSATCRKCHPQAFASWHASFHRTMTQRATDETVVGAFGVTLQHGDTKLRLAREDGRYIVYFKPGPTERRPLPLRAEIVQATGSHHLQAYWYTSERDRGRELALLPFCWRIDERRWIPVEAAFLMPPHVGLHVEPGAWNQSCLNCHATDGRPGLGPNPSAPIDSAVSEFGIACEACHGPGAQHVQEQSNPLTRYTAHLSEGDPASIVHPAKQSPERSAQICGQCHAASTARVTHYQSWRRVGYPYRPGGDLDETRLVVKPRGPRSPELQAQLQREPNLLDTTFWRDGTIRVAGREYNGLIESPCYQRGEGDRKMTCLSCHAMHSDSKDLESWRNDQPATGSDGENLLTDASCLQCHETYRQPDAVAAHTHHPVGSSGSSCLNCHMSYTTYGLHKAIRNHTITSPDVADELATTRPNACNQCHLDKTLAWSAEHLEIRYGIEQPRLDKDQRTVAESILWSLRGDAGQRALAAWSFGWDAAREVSGTEWTAPWLAELAKDNYAAVRFIARRSLLASHNLAPLADRYDFLASTTDRQAFATSILNQWRASARRPKRRRPDLLLGAGGVIVWPEARRILSMRDNRPMFLGE